MHAGVFVFQHGQLIDLPKLLKHGPQILLLEMTRDLSNEQFHSILPSTGWSPGDLRERQWRRGWSLLLNRVIVVVMVAMDGRCRSRLHHRRRRRQAYIAEWRLHIVPEEDRVDTEIRAYQHDYHSFWTLKITVFVLLVLINIGINSVFMLKLYLWGRRWGGFWKCAWGARLCAFLSVTP